MQMLNDNANDTASSKYHIYQFGSEPHDLCIRIGLQSFNLHRSIAAMRSEYLADLMKKKPLAVVADLVLEDITADTFLEICWWMYGSQLQIAAHNFCAVWNAAKKLKILELVENCRQYMSSIGSHHRSCHNQQRESQEPVVSKRIQPQRKSDKVVTSVPATLQIGHRPLARVSEQRSGMGETPNRKPVSLEKLLRKKKVENGPASLSSDEWFTMSEEEIIGFQAEDTVPRFLRDSARARIQSSEVFKTSEKTSPRLLHSVDPQHSCKIEENPDMVLVKTCELPKLAFLVERSHLVLNSAFLKGELRRSKGNCITLHHVDNQTVSNVLQWSLGGSRPLTSSNLRATLQLTSQLQMANLSAKCLEFWRNCIRDYLHKTPVEVSSAALVAQARSDWPLLGPYPFLINLVASRMQCPSEDACVISRDRDSAFGHAQILAKVLTGCNPRPSRTVTIPGSNCVKAELAPQIPSPSKPAVPASIKILGLRRTLELLNSRKTHAKTPSNKPNESKPNAETTSVPVQVPTSRGKATEVGDERKLSPKPASSHKTTTSLHVLANRKDSIRKRNIADKEIK